MIPARHNAKGLLDAYRIIQMENERMLKFVQETYIKCQACGHAWYEPVSFSGFCPMCGSNKLARNYLKD